MGSCFYDAVHSKAAELSGLPVILERVSECVCVCVCVCTSMHVHIHACGYQTSTEGFFLVHLLALFV